MRADERRNGGRARLGPIALVAAVVGLPIGFILGSAYTYAYEAPSQGWFPNTVGPIVATAVAIGLPIVLGLILLIPKSTRAVGQGLLAVALAIVVGLPLGGQFGQHYRPPRDYAGTMTLELTSPVVASLDTTGRCTTQADGDRVVTLTLDRLELGIDTLDVRADLGPAGGQLALNVNERNGYNATLASTDDAANAMSGHGSFSGSGGRVLIGGFGEGQVEGTLRWTCTADPAPSAPTAGFGDLQGWFILGGVIDMAHPCEGSPGCLPYGYAMGTCSRAFDLRTAAMDSVVPWTDGSRVRLHLVPGRQRAELTVTHEGGDSETATGAARVEEQMATAGFVVGRRLFADFVLSNGDLSVEVEWDCPDSVEFE